MEENKEVKEQEKQQPVRVAPPIVVANEKGMILGSNFDERWRVCTLYASSGMLPKGYDKPEKVFAGIQYALELGFHDKPLSALRNIAIINGQPSIWGEMPLALVNMSGQLLFIDEYFINKAGERLPAECDKLDVWAAICEVQRRGEEKKRFAFTQNDRTSLGVKAIWDSFTKIMMKRKARATALKDVFPDVLMGAVIAEYDHHSYLDGNSDKSSVEVLTPTEEKTSKFKERLKNLKDDAANAEYGEVVDAEYSESKE